MAEDWAAKNRDHFNETASTYDTKFIKTHTQIIAEIQAKLDWIGVDWVHDSDSDSDGNEDGASGDQAAKVKSVRLLDYACGTGTMSRALSPHVTQCLGIDISSAMVNEYNISARNQGIPESEMHAVAGDLIAQDEANGFEGEEWRGFDIAAVGMGFHHFVDPGLAAKRLVEKLKVGGVLLIIDFLPHGGHGHDHKREDGHGRHDHSHEKVGDVEEEAEGKGKMKNAAHTVTHMGFSEDDIKKIFEYAGAGKDFGYVVLGKGIVFTNNGDEQRRSVLMARGTKG